MKEMVVNAKVKPGEGAIVPIFASPRMTRLCCQISWGHEHATDLHSSQTIFSELDPAFTDHDHCLAVHPIHCSYI